MNNTHINKFIEPILVKRKSIDIKSYFKKRKIIKMLHNVSPSFNMMMEMHEFLTLLTNIYMYNNNDNFHLFLGSINNKNKNNLFAMIYKDNGFSIKYILYPNYENNKHQINIEITREGQNKNSVERISFYENEYQIKDKYDEEKMNFIITCLINGIIELIEFYYKNKQF